MQSKLLQQLCQHAVTDSMIRYKVNVSECHVTLSWDREREEKEVQKYGICLSAAKMVGADPQPSKTRPLWSDVAFGFGLISANMFESNVAL